jgi:RNA polymerase sigma-70 factor (ECF subfamily)
MTMDDASLSQTADLLRRWHAGDRQALDLLIAQHLPWLQEHVRRRLGPLLRRRGQTQDFVQEAMVDVLRYGPRFVLSDQAQFRALLGRIVENTLRDQFEWHTAKKRAVQREDALPSGSVVDLDSGARAVTRPWEAAERSESQEWIRLALELLEPEDRKVLLLREWHGLSFQEVGKELGMQENTARMRFQRALPKLAHKVRELRDGRLPDLVP